MQTMLLAVSLLSFCRESLAGADQRRLYHNLLKDHYSLERPVSNDSETLTVKFGITLLQIMDVDEKKQVMTTNVWLQMTWDAHNLVWDPEDYPGVRNIRLQNEKLWKPDIVLYNSADERFDATFHTNIVVGHTGTCTYIPPAILKSTCKMDVRWFPFDEQRCELKFGSWSYDSWAMDLEMMEAELSEYMPNGEWDLVAVPGVRRDKKYSCCEETYPDIVYTVIMRRRTLYYGLNLLIPCILISALALLVFLLPADSGEKISLGITVLLSLTVFLLLVAQIMPATSDTVPLISQYFATTMVIVGLSVIATVIVLQYHHHDPNGSKMPQWTRVFLLNWCAWFLRMKRPGEDRVRSSCPDKGPKSSVDLPLKVSSSGPQSHPSNTRLLHSSEEEPLVPGLELAQILEEVRYMAARLREQEREEELCNQWKFAACVIDRLCLVAFSILNLLCTLGILLSAPNFGNAISKDVFSN